ncbi:thioesterase family protein [Nocardioides sp. cx-173]|uniref:thioesterase family protein n=1 Tax=Nocardioides sp. cx-173 TaxID=2898796 RepID=UPI001E2EA5C1|nr:thioesterase family protein [Nocardioides sp. cx-173]MCD4525579.1 thioesterase family protein [Nocardioides sp. cx-173]UGB42723.1 thioesterase family protein [Nocardioides sp. cx-173]
MPSVFDKTTAVTPEGDGRYAAELDPGWQVGGAVNGGYLLGVVGNAIRAALPDKPDPLVLSAYFLSAAAPGPATVDVDVRRSGGSTSTVAADLRQDGHDRITVLATYGDLGRHGHDVRTTARPFDLPPVEDCVPSSMAPEEIRRIAPLMGRFDMRFHPDQVGWAVGKPSGQAVMSAWFKLEDGREPDPLSLLMVLDALPPVTFNIAGPGWAPTLELTAHVRARPAPGWLRVRHESRNVAGGMFEEDCEVWDAAGRLVAQSRQLALLPRV